MKSIHGLGTALVTPFKGSDIDWDGLATLIDHQISDGIDYIVTMGTTGESATLSPEEQHKVVRFTVDRVAGRIPIVMGIGGNNTAAVAHKMKTFDLTGIEAILSASPAYNKPSQAGILAHYKVLASAAPRPIIVYNVPGRTASNITTETTLGIAKLDNICGIKEASGDLTQGAEIIQGAPDNFAVLSGDDPTAFHLRSLGGNGCISVLSNLTPSQFRLVVFFKGEEEMKNARSAHLNFLDIHPWLYKDGNPVGIKAALNMQGWCTEDVRLPLVSITDQTRAGLKDAVQKAGLV